MRDRIKQQLATLISLLCVFIACSRQATLSPSEFTAEFAFALRQAAPHLDVQVIRDLELHVTAKDGRDFKTNMFLKNAYDSYKQNPKLKDTLFGEFITAEIELFAASINNFDKTRIVPIIKDKDWIKQDAHEYVYEVYNKDLIVVYGEDSPKYTVYLTPSTLKELRLDRTKLRSLACSNLKNILPQIERHEADGIYFLTVGGTYEASLLLLDDIWTKEQFDVRGDIVVAIPIRGVLLVTGSDDSAGIQKVRRLAEESYATGSYRLTPKLFVNREGKFAELKN